MASHLSNLLGVLDSLRQRVTLLEAKKTARNESFEDQRKRAFEFHKGERGAGCLPDAVRDAVIARFSDEMMVEEACVYNASRRLTVSLHISIPETHFHFVIEDGKPLCKVVAYYKAGVGSPASKRISEGCESIPELLEFISEGKTRVRYWETQVEPVLVEMGLSKVNGGEYSLRLSDGVLLTACPSLFPECVCMLLRSKRGDPVRPEEGGRGPAPKKISLKDYVAEDLDKLRWAINLLKDHPLTPKID